MSAPYINLIDSNVYLFDHSNGQNISNKQDVKTVWTLEDEYDVVFTYDDINGSMNEAKNILKQWFELQLNMDNSFRL